MADSIELIKPRRKRGRFTKLEYPFPVPEHKDIDEQKWFYYEGFLRENCVVVENIGDLTLLYKMGFFGKGVLSRSKPEYERICNISQLAFSTSDRLRRLPAKERRIRQSKFRKCRKERYCQHKKWSKLGLSPEDKEAVVPLQEEQSSDEEAVETDGDEMAADEGFDMDNDEDVRIDDLLQELVNKQSVESKDLKPVKPDPYKIYEFLQLTFEEAFFLSYGLGCLSISHIDQKLTLSSMWSEFSRRNGDFLRNYVGYHYYRSKGWVPQKGLKYGTDLVLYKKGMAFFHSSYAVVTSLVDENGNRLKSDKTVSNAGMQWTWKNLVSLNRLNEHVAKEVLLCAVTIPSETDEKDMENPNFVRKCKVQTKVLLQSGKIETIQRECIYWKSIIVL